MTTAAIEQRLDRIEQMLSQLTAVFVSTPQAKPVLSIADQAIQMARQGLHEESKAFLKAHSKRRSA